MATSRLCAPSSGETSVCATWLLASWASKPERPDSNPGSATTFEHPLVTLTVCSRTFPARSVPVSVNVLGPSTSGRGPRLKAPSGWTTTAWPPDVKPSTPDRASVSVPVIVTVGADTTAPSAGDVMVNTGGVVSRLTVSAGEAVLPARSVAVAAIG